MLWAVRWRYRDRSWTRRLSPVPGQRWPSREAQGRFCARPGPAALVFVYLAQIAKAATGPFAATVHPLPPEGSGPGPGNSGILAVRKPPLAACPPPPRTNGWSGGRGATACPLPTTVTVMTASPFGPAVAGPGGPCGPAGHWGPAGPCGPVAPAGPVSPLGPRGPCEPMEPMRLVPVPGQEPLALGLYRTSAAVSR
jgi:hypothetical protein